MARYSAIAAIGLPIKRLLEDARPPELATARVELCQYAELQAGLGTDVPGLSLYLYRVTPNGSRRTLPARVRPDGQRYRPALPIDLHYLLSAWGRDAQTQHQILGWAMRALGDLSILPVGLLNAQLSGPDVFRPDETVELVLDTPSLPDMASLWDIMTPKVQPSVMYVARLVAIESAVVVTEDEPVQTRDFRYGTPIEPADVGASR
ncbi:MAG: DUF4255 domain-containing protein [Chloroflexi bacterium]|nr:DUF4255 domain-containing protein [Chloroflexota bacterium]